MQSDPNTVNSSSQPVRWLFAWGNVTRIGGTEQRMLDAVQELATRGVGVEALVRNEVTHNSFQELVSESIANVRNMPSWLRYYVALRNFDGDVVWAFGLKQSLVARVVKLLHNVPWKLVMPRNGLDYEWRCWMHFVDRVSQRLIDLYITNSFKVGEHLNASGIDRSRIKAVPSGLSESWYASSQKPMSAKFLMVGNNRPQKNQMRGVKAFLKSDIPTTLTVYTNDGTSLLSYLSEVGERLRHRIIVVEGYQLNSTDYDSFGVLLHPSVSESLPLAILEAQARGCYILAADTGDTSRLVTNVNGLLFDPLSVDDISHKIKLIYKRIVDSRVRATGTKRTSAEYVGDLISVVEGRSTEQLPRKNGK